MLGLKPLSVPAPFEVWLAELHTEPAATLQAALSDGERLRAARFVFERDRRRYLAAHCALRHLLAVRTGAPADGLHFLEGPHGKPALQGAQRCAFNLSHSEDIALVALADEGDIGVDVEMLRPMPDATALAERNFSASECAELAATRADQRDLAFLLGWTRKEACLKAVGSGLSIAPHTFTAGLTVAPCSVRIESATGVYGVQVQSFSAGPQIVASLARIEPA
ncbi:MAG: 4'-phosphopantetheinyl transferase superfamily protein [Rhizobacter sp.]|nr:4'-phosphopantetheinyl transferase superfamily protein [Rhizobacter sp.]